MYNNPRKMVLGSSAMLAIAGAMMLGSTIMLSASGNSTTLAVDQVERQVTETCQETQMWTTYALTPYLSANDFKVSIHDGEATLTEEITQGADGLKQLKVFVI